MICRGSYSAILNNMKLIHWPLMGGLLYLVQWGGEWAATQSPPHCTKCYSSPINGQCTNHRIAIKVRCSAVLVCPWTVDVKWRLHPHSHWNEFITLNLHLTNANFDHFCRITIFHERLCCFVVYIRLASDSGPPGSNYFILLILTDGIITDMPQTSEAIVNVRIIIIFCICRMVLQ